MNRLKRALLVTTVLTLAACSAARIEDAKQLGFAAVPLFTKLAIAYGSPYAEIIRVFADTVDPSWNADGKYDRPSDDDGGREAITERDHHDETDDVGDEGPATTRRDTRGTDAGFDRDGLTAQIDVVREHVENGRQIAVPVADGDVLSADDNYKLQIRCSRECFAYVAQLDSTGKMDPILPSGLVSLQNPLAGGVLYSIPEGNDWFYLDASKGVEQIYLVVSVESKPEIERIFAKLAEANRSLSVKSPITVETPLVLTRGIGGVRQGQTQSVTFDNDRDGQYLSTVFESSGPELVITRWFDHR